MSFWKKAKDRVVLGRLSEEAFYEQAVAEMSQGIRRDGLWAKAIVLASGNETAARTKYISLLVNALKDEAYLAQRSVEITNEQQARSIPPPPEPEKSATPATGKRKWGVWDTVGAVVFAAWILWLVSRNA